LWNCVRCDRGVLLVGHTILLAHTRPHRTPHTCPHTPLILLHVHMNTNMHTRARTRTCHARPHVHTHTHANQPIDPPNHLPIRRSTQSTTCVINTIWQRCCEPCTTWWFSRLAFTRMSSQMCRHQDQSECESVCALALPFSRSFSRPWVLPFQLLVMFKMGTRCRCTRSASCHGTVVSTGCHLVPSSWNAT
jgi:hypothetical protein